MTDLVKLGHELVQDLPDGKRNFFSMESMMGEIVFGFRMQAGLTQEKLAKKAGVGLKTIHRVEGGSLSVSTDTYNKIFRALNVGKKQLIRAISETNDVKSYLKNKKKLIEA